MPANLNRLGMTALASVAMGSLIACHSEKDPFEDLVDFSTTTSGEDGDKKNGNGGSKKDPKGGGGSKTTEPKKGTTSGGGNQPNPGGGTGGGDKTGDGGGKKDCVLPARYVVLGDAVPAGAEGINGPDDPVNGFKKLHTYIKEKYKVAELSYENVAKAGAVTADIPGKQIDTVDTGKAGHVLVNIHVGGNDLAKFILKSDKAAQDAFDGTISKAEADWRSVFDFFEDKSKFPDGATFIVNTQYNPFDDCTELHNLFRVSDAKIELMKKFNQRLRDLTKERKTGIVADQYLEFLGHGHHHAKSQCPHYKDGADYWLIGGADLTNINEKGYAAMGRVFEKVADTLYAGCPKQ